ncbi:protein phosphatase inhibitor 2-like [Tribolium madens]|uniref:protein phosphatase inhibitor 2-like n=1 Tax=Tribolium madens TaxID=41895 RepID=UPI001CF73B85|nr:protein phosphatase inhibitor 2-like [Tribolium madens]
MADKLQKKPSKGILKNSSSFDKQEAHAAPRKSINKTTWDEMNIMATLHPPDKDYGHMKIDEPKTPYNYLNPDKVDGLNLSELEEKIKSGAALPPKALLEQDDSSDEDEDLTPEERAKKREFEHKRKKHYNEFYAVKLARKLLEEEEDDDTSPTSSPKHKAHEQSCSKNSPN